MQFFPVVSMKQTDIVQSMALFFILTENCVTVIAWNIMFPFIFVVLKHPEGRLFDMRSLNGLIICRLVGQSGFQSMRGQQRRRELNSTLDLPVSFLIQRKNEIMSRSMGS